jgi:hypothetical protein
MFKLAMTAARGNHVPAVIFYKRDRVADLHAVSVARMERTVIQD